MVSYEEFYNTHKYFSGALVVGLRNISAEGKVPASVTSLMELKLNLLREQSDPTLTNMLLNDNITSGDAILFHPNGSFKVVLDGYALFDSKYMVRCRNITLGKDLEESVAAYNEISGEEFSRQNMLLDQSLTADQAKSHPLWKALARYNQNLLDDYVDVIFSYNTDELMSIKMPILQPNKVIGTLCDLNDALQKSYLDITLNIWSGMVHLIGEKKSIKPLKQ